MKRIEELRLSVKSSAWREDGDWESKKESWKSIREGILERDHQTCMYCGFQGTKYQEVHHLDNDHDNNDESNLITVCAMCHACHHLGLAGSMGRGTLIYLPELKQQDVHWMVRWISLSVYADDMGGYLDAPRKMFGEFLIHRKKVCESMLGMSNPLKWGNMMLSSGEQQFEEYAGRMLSHIRLIPATMTDREIQYLAGYMPEQVAHWKEQMKSLVPDMTQIMEYINAGTIQK